MEGLINQAFSHVEGIGEHVMHGRYDLIGPDKEIIMPNYWESTVEPDMHITMMLWPIPEPQKEEEIVVPPDFDPDAILSLDDILHPPKNNKKRKLMLLSSLGCHVACSLLTNLSQQRRKSQVVVAADSQAGCWGEIPGHHGL